LCLRNPYLFWHQELCSFATGSDELEEDDVSCTETNSTLCTMVASGNLICLGSHFVNNVRLIIPPPGPDSTIIPKPMNTFSLDDEGDAAASIHLQATSSHCTKPKHQHRILSNLSNHDEEDSDSNELCLKSEASVLGHLQAASAAGNALSRKDCEEADRGLLAQEKLRDAIGK
jgi:hypothetical protein